MAEVKIVRGEGKTRVTVTLDEAPLLASLKATKEKMAGGSVEAPKISAAQRVRIYKLTALRQALDLVKTAIYAEVASDEQVINEANAEKARINKLIDERVAKVKAARPKGTITIPADSPGG
jgi:hypothetical protein